jgi:hypothetical protein
MSSDRLERALVELSARGDGALSSDRLGETCRDILAVSGAGVMLISGDRAQGSLFTTNEVSALIEELQFSLGEGPCLDAYRQDKVVAEPDLANPFTPRWLAFAPAALQAGAQAVFAFPLRVGSIRIGSLDLYMDRPGSLSEDQHADALMLADVAASWVLDTQAGASPGALAERLESGDFHLVVQNAAGMVSVQLGVSVTEALLRLRAYAFGQGRLLTGVAEDVVARKLRF